MTEPDRLAGLAVARTPAAMRGVVAGWRAAGQRVALVPTMGALHEGHLSLIAVARSRADRVVASVFVNPTQFGPTEDFDAYPRTLERDAALLAEAGCDLLYAPAASVMYPQGFCTTITVAGVAEPLDGEARPGHFAGVATVVAKLLLQAAPDVAVFGEKDFQQLQVIRRLAIDLDLPVEIVGAPTARAADGLALSSRNAYLAPADRERAAALPQALSRAVAALEAGAPAEDVEREAAAALLAAGFSAVDYVSVRDPETLQPLHGPVPRARLLAAARLAAVRLIDNMPVGGG